MKLIFLATVLFSITEQVFCQDLEQKVLKIGSVNFLTTTTFSISCDDFFASFGDRIAYREVRVSDTLDLLNEFLKKVKYSSSSEGFDVRAKFILSGSDNTQREICINNFFVSVDGRRIKNNKKSLKFLKSFIKKEHLSHSPYLYKKR